MQPVPPINKLGLDLKLASYDNIGPPSSDKLNVSFSLNLLDFVIHPEFVRMAGNVKRFYDLTAKMLSGKSFSFSALKDKVVLIENVASL